MKDHEDFRKRLLDHLVDNYSDEYIACQAATAMIIEYTYKFPLIEQTILKEVMNGWRKAKEPKKDYVILDQLYSFCVPAREVISIKRLSDNEIFTVGDHILEGEIKGITITESGTCYLKDEDWVVRLDEAAKYVEDELTPTCEGFWKQFEILTNDPDFIAERNVLLGYEYTEEDMLDFGKFCQMYKTGICTEDIFNAWIDDRGDN